MTNKLNEKNSKIELLINKLTLETESGKIDWLSLVEFSKKSRTISKYISTNSNYSNYKDISIKRHSEEYKFYYINSEQSLYTETNSGRIFLFIFNKSDDYTQNLIDKLTGQDKIKIILGLQIEKHTNLEELTTFDEYQLELRKLYVKAKLVRNDVFNFIR